LIAFIVFFGLVFVGLLGFAFWAAVFLPDEDDWEMQRKAFERYDRFNR